MNNLKFAILIYLFFSNFAQATPVWENKNIICKTFLHTIIHETGYVEEINSSSNIITLDFENNKAMSGYGNSTGFIKYLDYQLGADPVSMLRIDWDSGFIQYYEIIHKDNGFYFSGSSGYNDQDGLIYSVHYKCN